MKKLELKIQGRVQELDEGFDYMLWVESGERRDEYRSSRVYATRAGALNALKEAAQVVIKSAEETTGSEAELTRDVGVSLRLYGPEPKL